MTRHHRLVHLKTIIVEAEEDKMSSLNQLKDFFKFLLTHKWKFVLCATSVLVFIVVLFPFNDLTDLITSQVSKLTKNSVYIQMDELELSALPTGIRLGNLLIETSQFPAIRTKELTVSPSVMSVINKKPAGSMKADGFLDGSVFLSLAPGSKTENGIERQKIEIRAEQINLAKVRNFVPVPIPFKGTLKIESSALADLTFNEQPDMDLQIEISKFEIPTSNIETPLGPLTMPELKLGQLQLKGRLSNGRFQIEQGVLGKPGDDLVGTVKGGIGLQINNRNGTITPQIGAYSLEVDMTTSPAFTEKASLFLTFIEQHKKSSPQGARYSFKVSASGPQSPPSVSALR